MAQPEHYFDPDVLSRTTRTTQRPVSPPRPIQTTRTTQRPVSLPKTDVITQGFLKKYGSETATQTLNMTENFANYLLNHFKYFLFDFDRTLSIEHMSRGLEQVNWKRWLDKQYNNGKSFLSNIEFLKQLISGKTPEQQVIIISHSNNENGIRYILNQELGENLASNILILAGRNQSQTDPNYRPVNSLAGQEVFLYDSSKKDMLNYLELIYYNNLNANNTVFFDDTDANKVACNSDISKKCTFVNVIYDPMGGAFKENYLQKYKDELQKHERKVWYYFD